MKRLRRVLGGISLLVLLGAALALGRSRTVYALTKSTTDFVTHPVDGRVRYEPGAERLADSVAAFLDAAIETVEAAHGLPFVGDFEVLVCASQESLNEFVAAAPGSPLRGTAVMGDVYLAPSAFAWHGEDTHRSSLLHELSHLHLSQRVGYYGRRARIPAWFHEGLADLASGAGGETISEEEAAEAIRRGRHFSPDPTGTLLGPRIPPEWGISAPMHHRQSRMFVDYLSRLDPEAFRLLVLDVQVHGRFKEPFRERFRQDPIGYWAGFVEALPPGG